MKAKLFRNRLAQALSAAAVAVAFVPLGNAAVQRVDMQLDGFCTVECRFDIEHALYPFEDEYETLDVSAEKQRVTFVPKEDTRVQLWDVIRQLKNAERIPLRTTILASGMVEDYTVSLNPRGRVFTRKALFDPDTGIRFLLNSGGAFADVLSLSAGGSEAVAVFGEVVAWDKYHLPILVVDTVKSADAEWSDEEVEALIAQEGI